MYSQPLHLFRFSSETVLYMFGENTPPAIMEKSAWRKAGEPIVPRAAAAKLLMLRDVRGILDTNWLMRIRPGHNQPCQSGMLECTY